MKIIIHKLQHQLISRFRSKDRNRQALNHIGVIDGDIYATDGRRCVKIKMNAPIPDGTYRFFFEGSGNGDYFLFKEEYLFPNAKQIMPNFSELVEVCKIIPRKNDGLMMMNCIIEVFEKTTRRINLSFLTDLDVGHEYSVLTKKGEEKKHDAYLYLRCESEDNLYGKPEVVLLPFNH